MKFSDSQETVQDSIGKISAAIGNAFSSPNVLDSNHEWSNIVDVVDRLASSTKRVADSITPNVLGSCDASGGHVESLTEAVMGVTRSLCEIADAIRYHADRPAR